MCHLEQKITLKEIRLAALNVRVDREESKIITEVVILKAIKARFVWGLGMGVCVVFCC